MRSKNEVKLCRKTLQIFQPTFKRGMSMHICDDTFRLQFAFIQPDNIFFHMTLPDQFANAYYFADYISDRLNETLERNAYSSGSQANVL